MSKNKIVCFGKGTLIKGVKNFKKIEEVQPHERILSYNFHQSTIEEIVVRKVAKSNHSIINEITFSNGSKIRSTIDHPYWVKGKGWCSVENYMTEKNYSLSVKKLKLFDYCLLLKDNMLEEVQVLNIETKTGNFDMFNISGGKHHNFFANGILVHDENLVDLDLDKHKIEYSTI